MPSLRVLLVGKRLFEIGVIGEKISAQSLRDRFVARFVKQLGVSFISKSISGCSGDCSGVKIVVAQLEPPFLLREEQCSKVNQGFVEAAHIQLFNSRWGWMKREAAERANFWHESQEKCLEACAEAWFFIDVAPILTVLRIRDVVDKFLLGLAGVAVLNLISLEMPCHCGITVETAWR